MKVKVSEATGPVLDYMVAVCKGETEVVRFSAWSSSQHYFAPSRRWAQAGPIIERERIDVLGMVEGPSGDWTASIPRPNHVGWRFIAKGPTPLIAAMRCYVVSKLGDEVEVPDELL